jgi:hypothetical protein
LTYANVVSSLCLFLVLAGGSAFAAAQITGAQIASNAITSAKVKNGSLLKVDFKPGQLPRGPVGPRGPAGANGVNGVNGANGANGTAKAYAMFDATAQQVVPQRTFNMTITRANVGIYCIDAPGLNPTTSTILATAAFPTTGIPLIFAQARTNGNCLPQQFEIATVDGGTATLSNTISFAVAIM